MQRHYQLVFLWVKDGPKFSRYMEQVRPIVRRYGGHRERMIAPKTIYGEGVTLPTIVNVVYTDDKATFDKFSEDEDFARVKHLRAESIDMMAIEGRTERGEVAPGNLQDRIYMIELARFKNSPAAYRKYEEEAESAMRPYGYHVERVIVPEAPPFGSLPFAPDIVKVAYFDSHKGFDEFHDDPAHSRIENELYPAAVKESIWIIGRVHPDALGGDFYADPA